MTFPPPRSSTRFIRRLSNKIRREYDRFTTKGELTGSQVRVLLFILEHQEDMIFQKDIEIEYSMRSSSASELLKQMVLSGLIEKKSIPDDRRLKQIIPTQKAIAFQNQVIEDLNSLESKLTKDISLEDLDIFFKVIAKMHDNLNDQ